MPKVVKNNSFLAEMNILSYCTQHKQCSYVKTFWVSITLKIPNYTIKLPDCYKRVAKLGNIYIYICFAPHLESMTKEDVIEMFININQALAYIICILVVYIHMLIW